MQKNLIKNITKAALALCLSCILLFHLLLNLSFTTKAETVDLLPSCTGQKCFTDLTDITISDDGSFSLAVDSGIDPFIKKFDISSGMVTNTNIIPLNDRNPNKASLKIGVSKDTKRVFLFSEEKILPSSSSSGEVDLFGRYQVNQGTDCNCPSGSYFNESLLCVVGTLDCSNVQSDPVCSCDNRNFLNSCIARANGIKKFTKGECGVNANISCISDSQCPNGACPNGSKFKRFTCTGNKCTLIPLSTDPCFISTTDCKCPSGSFFDEMDCMTGTLKCPNISDPVCSCNNLDFLNSCVARANGIKIYTKGNCGSKTNLNCTTDSQCPSDTCPNGRKFKKFNCLFGKCIPIEFSIDPCSSSSSSGGFSSSVVRIIDLTNNSIKNFTPTSFSKTSSSTTDNNEQSVSTVSFFDAEGKKLLASNEDTKDSKLFLINSETGEIEKKPSIPGVLKSIELTPDFKKAVVTFKDTFAHSIGILNTKTKELIKFDIPQSIFFKIDEFLSMTDIDLFSDKAVVSSLDGEHVLHILNLKDNRLTIKFLKVQKKNLEGPTHSTISLDGTIAVSVGNNIDGNEIVVYKLNIQNVRLPKILKISNFQDGSKALDVLITPDNNKIVILTQKENEKKLKILSLEDLSLLCEFTVSVDTDSSFLLSEPYGRYLLSPNFKTQSVSLISDLQTGPVFRSIIPNKGPKEGSTQFTIDGFIDQSIFTGNVKVCFGNKNICSSSTTISNDGKTITGTTPKFPRPSFTDIILIAEKNSNVLTTPTSSGFVQCTKDVNKETVYKKAFKFE